MPLFIAMFMLMSCDPKPSPMYMLGITMDSMFIPGMPETDG